MLPLTALSAAQYKTYVATLATSHEIKITVQVLDNEHRVLSTISSALLAGQVDGYTVWLDRDGNIATSRTCSLQFLDPTGAIGFDSNSPTDGALYLDRMLRIVYSVRCPGFWADVPVFTGPVTKVDRSADVVTVEGQGMEAFGQTEAFYPAQYSGRKDDALRRLLWRMGETDKYMQLPSSSQNLTKPVNVGRDQKLWPKAVRVANSLNRVMYYDGRGVVRTPVKPTKVSFHFRSGEGGMILTEPQVTYSTDNLKNAVWVKGGKPKGSKTAVSALVVAPSSHPLNPFKIGRRGKGRFMLIVEENGDIRSKAAAVARAKTLLADSLVEQVEVAFDSLPVPHLEPWDWLWVSTPGLSTGIRAHSFSLPLTHDGVMTVGYTRIVSKPKRIVKRS